MTSKGAKAATVALHGAVGILGALGYAASSVYHSLADRSGRDRLAALKAICPGDSMFPQSALMTDDSQDVSRRRVPSERWRSRPGFYEFFAGGGMVRAGLGAGWHCLFANDFDAKKGRSYARNWGDSALTVADVRTLNVADIPGRADLAWASFPCQDLSLAGGGAGLRGNRSGTFWPFWNLIRGLRASGRAPRTIVLENVCGTLTSHGGDDFRAICTAFQEDGYRCGAVVMDAALFVPQSRPRLFVVGVAEIDSMPAELAFGSTSSVWHPPQLLAAYNRLPINLKANWVWWRMPLPSTRSNGLADVVEAAPPDVSWHSAAETRKLLAMMSELNLAKVEEAKCSGRTRIGTVYKRTRIENGAKVQRAEVRFDDTAGCLRTPAGGSSRQVILVVDGRSIRSRLISGRETARLMGLSDSYALPERYNEAYHLTGDGVVVPVIRHLARYVLEPLVVSDREVALS